MACEGGRGSELLRLRPAFQVSSVAGAGAMTGAGVGWGASRLCCEVGLLIRTDPLRSPWVVEEGADKCELAGGCEDGEPVVVVIVGDVTVVDWGPKSWTMVPCPGEVEVVVVVVCGPDVVVVVVVEVIADGPPCSSRPFSMVPACATRFSQERRECGCARRRRLG
jgi:hypothetical protein